MLWSVLGFLQYKWNCLMVRRENEEWLWSIVLFVYREGRFVGRVCGVQQCSQLGRVGCDWSVLPHIQTVQEGRHQTETNRSGHATLIHIVKDYEKMKELLKMKIFIWKYINVCKFLKNPITVELFLFVRASVLGFSKFCCFVGNVISWLNGLLHYNARQCITLLNVCSGT